MLSDAQTCQSPDRYRGPIRVVMAMLDMVVACSALNEKNLLAERAGILRRILLAEIQMPLKTPIPTEVLAKVRATRVRTRQCADAIKDRVADLLMHEEVIAWVPHVTVLIMFLSCIVIAFEGVRKYRVLLCRLDQLENSVVWISIGQQCTYDIMVLNIPRSNHLELHDTFS
jgi:hypothetical protein